MYRALYLCQHGTLVSQQFFRFAQRDFLKHERIARFLLSQARKVRLGDLGNFRIAPRRLPIGHEDDGLPIRYLHSTKGDGLRNQFPWLP